MQTIRELRIILKISKIIEEQLSEFILKPHSHKELLKKLQELHLPEFKIERQKILGLSNPLSNEHETSKLIILIGNINTKFTSIENLVDNSPHKTNFFKKNNNLTNQLQNHLKAIREELNKVEFDNEPNQLSDFTSPAPGA